MNIKEEDIESKDAVILINQLSDTLSKITGSSGKSSFNNDDVKNDRSLFVIGRINGKPAGCGAIREISKDTAELKRMYAVNKGKGTGKEILIYLENKARKFGYKEIILEIRKCNNNAVNFYIHNNYKIIDNYGKYKNRAEAVCFKKVL